MSQRPNTNLLQMEMGSPGLNWRTHHRNRNRYRNPRVPRRNRCNAPYQPVASRSLCIGTPTWFRNPPTLLRLNGSVPPVFLPPRPRLPSMSRVSMLCNLYEYTHNCMCMCMILISFLDLMGLPGAFWSDTMDTVRNVLGNWGRKVGEATKKAETLAGNTWQHCKFYGFRFLLFFF